MSDRDKPALVTGASGFVGSAVARALLGGGRAGARAGAAVERPPQHRRARCRGARDGSLEDRASLDAALAGCGALFHVAADYRLWVRDPAAMYARQRRRHAGADGGRARRRRSSASSTPAASRRSASTPDGAPADETDAEHARRHDRPLQALEVPGRAARSRRWCAQRGLPAVIVNPSTPIGPRDVKPTPTGRMIVEAASGRMPAFVDTGLNLVHVDDVARGPSAGRGARPRSASAISSAARTSRWREILRRDRASSPAASRRPCRLPIAGGLAGGARRRGGRRASPAREPFVTLDGLRMARTRRCFSPRPRPSASWAIARAPRRAALADAIAWFRAAGCAA